MDTQAVADFRLRCGGGEAAVRLDKLKQLRAVAAPSEAQREKIAQLEAGEAVDMQAVADFRLRRGDGEAAVRLGKLKQLHAVAAPSEAQRENIAQLNRTASVVDGIWQGPHALESACCHV